MNFTVTAVDVFGNKLSLPPPISVNMSLAFDAPADSLQIVLPCSSKMPELTEIDLKTNGSVAFSGIVDEQILNYNDGCTVKIIARSRAALLLDNEAVPAVYHTPSLTDIYSIHAKPYGIAGFNGYGRCKSDITVKKGMSEWEVIDTFCRSSLNIIPRINADNILDATEKKSLKSYIFSNTLPNAVRFTNAKVSICRYGTVSEILYKLSPDSGYIYKYQNSEAAKKGISCRRILNLSSADFGLNEYRIKSIIRKSELDSLEITLCIADICLTDLFAGASLSDPVIGDYDNLCVKEIEFSMGKNGVFTLLTLCPSKNISAT